MASHAKVHRTRLRQRRQGLLLAGLGRIQTDTQIFAA